MLSCIWQRIIKMYSFFLPKSHLKCYISQWSNVGGSQCSPPRHLIIVSSHSTLTQAWWTSCMNPGTSPYLGKCLSFILSMQASLKRKFSFKFELKVFFAVDLTLRTQKQLAHWKATLRECCSSWNIEAKLNKT